MLEEHAIRLQAYDRAATEESSPASARSGERPAAGRLVHGALGRPSRDELTQQDVCVALLTATDMGPHHIEVEMTDAGMLLRGIVASPADRERALRTARAIAGRRVVREALTVQPSAAHDPAGTPPSSPAPAAGSMGLWSSPTAPSTSRSAAPGRRARACVGSPMRGCRPIERAGR